MARLVIEPVWVVMAGHSASEDARERAYAPAIPIEMVRPKDRDARDKPAHDDQEDAND